MVFSPRRSQIRRDVWRDQLGIRLANGQGDDASVLTSCFSHLWKRWNLREIWALQDCKRVRVLRSQDTSSEEINKPRYGSKVAT